ncbi:hypothetical protein F383_21082 [Gossypium arboreum]|uniref:Uncharacterized protein n=1 Tax=Gossypium arboreum TaxID=29729 RepID=A0A0B0NVW0_GOSAR|nr:hypothetical protein F383_21082 [Gossypium arboreum]
MTHWASTLLRTIR